MYLTLVGGWTHHPIYWTYEDFQQQTEGVMDVIECLHPGVQIVIEVDHSQGHAKRQEGGLNANDMNMTIGKKQSIPRPGLGSRITKGCLEPPGHERGEPQITEGNTQFFEFTANCPPPEFEAHLYPNDSHIGKAKGKVELGSSASFDYFDHNKILFKCSC